MKRILETLAAGAARLRGSHANARETEGVGKPGRHSVFYRWVISYVLLLMVAVGLCLSIALNARELLMGEYEAGSAGVRTVTSRLLDTYLENVYAQQSQYVKNDTLSQFLARDMPYTGADMYLLVDLKEQLYNYFLYSMDSTTSYIYLHSLEKGLSHSSIYDSALLMDVYHADVAVSDEEMLEALCAYHGRDFVITPKKDGGVSVMLMSSVPNSAVYNPKATVVQILDGDFLADLLRDSTQQMGMYMYLVDSRGYVISASGPAVLAQELIEANLLLNGTQHSVYLGGEEYMVSVDNSTVPKWYYVTMISPHALNDKIAALNRTAIMICLLCLCVGTVMSYALARHQYRPMAQVISRLSDQCDHKDASDEYGFILAAFDNIGEANRNIDRLWRQQTLILQKEFLTSALLGSITGDAARMAQALDIPVQGYGYFVLLMSAYGAATDVDSTLDAAMQRCAEAAETHGTRAYRLDLREPHVLVLIADEEKAEKCYDAICAQVLSIVAHEKWDAMLLAAPSPLTRDISTLNLCYLDAAFMLEEKRKRKRESNSLPQELNLSTGFNQLEYTDHAATAICMAVRNGNAEEADERLAQMLRNCPEWVEPSQHMMLTRLLSDMLESLSPSCRKEAAYARLPNRLALRMRNTTQREEIRLILQEGIRVVSDACAQERQSSLMEAILACVDSHYAEMDFNVSKVAQLMNMNMSYLSQYFRDQSGIGLLEYISRVRVSRAKAFIQSADDHVTIKQVAQQVGFENINSFIRVFKKYEGVTPGEFKKGEK